MNAANKENQAGGVVCEAIFAAAGMKKLQDACMGIRRCNTGSAIITHAFDLKARYIIHAVGLVGKTESTASHNFYMRLTGDPWNWPQSMAAGPSAFQ